MVDSAKVRTATLTGVAMIGTRMADPAAAFRIWTVQRSLRPLTGDSSFSQAQASGGWTASPSRAEVAGKGGSSAHVVRSPSQPNLRPGRFPNRQDGNKKARTER